MTSKERMRAALGHREADRVPVAEVYVDYAIVQQVIGRPTLYRAHARETFALWDGRRDEMVDGQKRDLVEFVRRTGVDAVPVWLVPPRNQVVEKPRRIAEGVWQDRAGTVLRYVPETEDLVVVQRGDRPVEPVAQPPPDGSEWELWDWVVQELGQSHYLLSPGGTALGIGGYGDVAHRFRGFEEWMLRLRDEPERIAEEELACLQGYREQVRELARRGLDAVRISPDYGYGRTTYCSPEVFRRAFLPGLTGLCREIHAGGLDVLFHCDANMSELMPEMVAAGADIYQSIEPHEPIDRYKLQVGQHLTLWGGVSCHDLCAAPSEEIRRQARFAIRHCGPGGGFILGSSHNILTATRYDNFMAMLDTAFTEGRYPLR
jgi:hypothetical protein